MSRSNTHFMYIRAEIPQTVHVAPKKKVVTITKHRVGAIAFGFARGKIFAATSIIHPEDRSQFCDPRVNPLFAGMAVKSKIGKKAVIGKRHVIQFNLESDNWTETARAVVKLLNVQKILKGKWAVDIETTVHKLAEAMRIQYETQAV